MEDEVIEAMSADEEKIRAPDSILEPGTEHAVESFLKRTGREEDVRHFLTDEYDGLADMINLVSLWTETAGGDANQIQEDVAKQLVLSGFNVKRADAAFKQWVDTSTEPPSFIDGLNQSELWSSVIDELWEKNKSSTFLHYVKKRQGLVGTQPVSTVETPETYMSSLIMLTEQLLGRESVGEEELRAYYDAVCQHATYDETRLVLALRLFAELAASASGKPNLQQLYRRCSQEIRLHARQAMGDVANVPDETAEVYTARLAMIVETQALAGAPPPDSVVASVSRLAFPSTARNGGLRPRRVNARPGAASATPRSSVSGPSATTGVGGSGGDEGVTKDVGHLKEVYIKLVYDDNEAIDVDNDDDVAAKVSEAEAEALVQALCQPEVFKGMLRAVFVQSVRSPGANMRQRTPQSDVVTEVRRTTSLLLSVAGASLGKTQASSGTGRSKRTKLDAEWRARVQSEYAALSACALACEVLHPSCPRHVFGDTAILDATDARGERIESDGEQSRQSNLDVVIQSVSVSATAALGALEWAREGMLHDSVDPTKLKGSVEKYIQVVMHVAETHPLLRMPAMDLLLDAYGTDPYRNDTDNRVLEFANDLRTAYGNALTGFVRMRVATRVIRKYRERFAETSSLSAEQMNTSQGVRVDAMHLRGFVGKILEIVRPQYSVGFAKEMVELLSVTAIQQACNRKPEVRRLASAFVKEATGMRKFDSDLLDRLRRVYS